MAGAGKKTFTAGEVLTASDVNAYLMEQSVMYFGGTAARASAIPTPSTGMTTYNQTSGQLETYNGSAYIGMSGLQLIKKQTVGTGVSSVEVTSAFSATYENYRIIYSGGTQSASTFLALKLGASATGYYGNLVYQQMSNLGSVLGTGDNNGAQFTFFGGGDSNASYGSGDLLGAFSTKYTRLINANYLTSGDLGFFSGIHKVAASYTSFTLLPSSGTLTGGTIYVYGYGV